MANVTLRGNALYCGPGTNYAGAATGVYGKSAEVLWKEDAYYCVRLSNPKVEGYISNRYVTIPSGTSVSTFTPPDDEIRYVNTSSSAYLGQGTTYETISQPERGQEVYYLGKKVGTLAYIEYTLHSSTKKYRAWFPHMSLTINPPSRLSAEDYIYNIETLVTPYDYNPIGDQTFCNRYAFYAMKECNANLPTKSDGVTPGNCQEMYDELITNQYSKWRITDFAEAQHRANFGCPTIALSPNVQNQLGHAAVVRPNNGSTPNSKADVYITQAGKSVFKNRKLSEGWVVGSAQYNAIRFFTWLY